MVKTFSIISNIGLIFSVGVAIIALLYIRNRTKIMNLREDEELKQKDLAAIKAKKLDLIICAVMFLSSVGLRICVMFWPTQSL